MQIIDAIVSHGCFLRECSVQHSIVGVRSRLESGVELKVSYLLYMLLDANMSISKSFFMLYFKRQLDSLIVLDNIVPWGIRWRQKHLLYLVKFYQLLVGK